MRCKQWGAISRGIEDISHCCRRDLSSVWEGPEPASVVELLEVRPYFHQRQYVRCFRVHLPPLSSFAPHVWDIPGIDSTISLKYNTVSTVPIWVSGRLVWYARQSHARNV